MKRPKFVVYKAADGYRWRLVAANGRIVADSGEAYTRPADANRAVKSVIRSVRQVSRPPRPSLSDVMVMARPRWTGVEFKEDK